MQVPPIGEHVSPDGTHVPPWQAPPEQQSESDVHVPVLSGMHEAAHFSAPVESGTQMLLQQLSHQRARNGLWGNRRPCSGSSATRRCRSVGRWPCRRRSSSATRRGRRRPSPAGTQKLCAFWHRRTPSESAAPQEPEQQPPSEVRDVVVRLAAAHRVAVRAAIVGGDVQRWCRNTTARRCTASWSGRALP